MALETLAYTAPCTTLFLCSLHNIAAPCRHRSTDAANPDPKIHHHISVLTIDHPPAAMHVTHLCVEVQVADEDAPGPGVLDRRGAGPGLTAAHRPVHPQMQALHLWHVETAVRLADRRADELILYAARF